MYVMKWGKVETKAERKEGGEVIKRKKGCERTADRKAEKRQRGGR